MKTIAGWGMFVGTALAAFAGREDDVILAAMHLGEQPGYTWTTAVRDDARAYAIDGKTNPGGYTWARLPMVDKVAERLGREADTQIEAFFKGQGCVIRFRSGWKTFAELPLPEWTLNDSVEFSMPYDPFASSPDLSEPPEMIVLPRRPPPERERPYSNARLGVAPPHEELAIVVSSYTSLNFTDGIATGTLTDLGAALLLAPGELGPAPVAAAGSFKLWIKDGRVMRYRLSLEGVVVVDRQKIHVHQNSETTVKEIGRVALAVPEVVKMKLARQ